MMAHTPASQTGKQKHQRESRLVLDDGKVQIVGAFAKIRVPLFQPCTDRVDTKASSGFHPQCVTQCFEANMHYSRVACVNAGQS